MWQSALELLRAPHSDDYLQAQHYRLLHTMLVATFLVACVTTAVNVTLRDTRGAIILLVLAIVSLVGVFLSHRRLHTLAASVFCFAIFSAITLEAFYGGGIHDSAITAYAVLILCATFLFGARWGLIAGTLAAIIGVIGLWLAEDAGWVLTPFPATPFRVIALSAIFLAMAGVTQVVRGTWDDNVQGLVDSYDKTLNGWALALEYRDGETAGHCKRVVGLSVGLAQRLGCSAEEIDSIRRGAYLHDIGKMAIPDHILKKPGPLTAEEREIIEQHPDLGLRLIADIPFLASAACIMYAHHECWDGTGYPKGLKGEQIPLGARIFAIVDQWDALNSDRPYRKAWPRADVVAHIRKNSGTSFDPKVASAFLTLVAETC